MALSLFKKKDEPLPTALGALRADLATQSAVLKRKTSVALRLQTIYREREQTEQLKEELFNLRNAIARRIADARYEQLPDPDVSEDQKTLKVLQERVYEAEGKVEMNNAVAPRLQSDLTALSKEQETLKPELDRKLHAALVEQMVALQPELEAAQALYLGALRRVFSAAVAADGVSKAASIGQSVDAANYLSIRLPKPNHEVFHPSKLTPEQSQRQAIDDVASLNGEAAALVERLLETDD